MIRNDESWSFYVRKYDSVSSDEEIIESYRLVYDESVSHENDSYSIYRIERDDDTASSLVIRYSDDMVFVLPSSSSHTDADDSFNLNEFVIDFDMFGHRSMCFWVLFPFFYISLVCYIEVSSVLSVCQSPLSRALIYGVVMLSIPVMWIIGIIGIIAGVDRRSVLIFNPLIDTVVSLFWGSVWVVILAVFLEFAILYTERYIRRERWNWRVTITKMMMCILALWLILILFCVGFFVIAFFNFQFS